MADQKKTTDAESWSAYWAGAEAASQPIISGATGEALDRFWTAFLTERLKTNSQSMIELACGAGPVSTRAATMADAAGIGLAIHGADYAPAAIRSVCSAVSNVAGFVADAAVLPLPDGAYDVAVSQFGLEYAGPAAFDEAARILRPGGAFGAVIHLKGGGIEEECAANLNIVTKAQKIEFLPRARDAFNAGFAVLAGQAPRKRFTKADKAFAPTVKAAKALIVESPPVLARAFLERLYADLGHMYRRIKAYAPEDIEAWIARGEFELKAYEHRMASMIAAAQSRDDIASLADRLRAAGLVVSAPEILALGEPQKPAAWALVAERPARSEAGA